MKFFLSFIFLNIIIAHSCYAQLGKDDWVLKLIEPKFNATAIIKNKISKVYVIETSGERDLDGVAENKDTLEIIYFDANGCIIQKNTDKDSSIFNTIVSNEDSTIIEYKFYKYGKSFDSTFIIKKVFSKNGKLIEYQSIPSNAYSKSVDCSNGLFYHFKFNYNDAGKLALYKNLMNLEYRKIYYTDYGKKVGIYRARPRVHQDTEFILVSTVEDKLNNIITINETSRTLQVSRDYQNQLLQRETTIILDTYPIIKYIEYHYE